MRGQHLGRTLHSFILYQYYQTRVSRRLLLAHRRRDWVVDISTGQLEHILTENQDPWHAEKHALLAMGLEVSTQVTVDDTGRYHQRKHGYTPRIGNAYFARFQTTKTPQRDADLQALSIDNPRHVCAAIEGALLGGRYAKGLADGLAIISDEAGQFDVLTHWLCWVHAERLVHKLTSLNEGHCEDQQAIRAQIWDVYAEIKRCQKAPTEAVKAELKVRFDAIFTSRTRYETLSQLLKRLRRHKAELPRVLERPDMPSHTNDAENDLRDRVKKHHIRGGTRSEAVRCSWRTFASLKTTCRKVGILFWVFLIDRVSDTNTVPPLPVLIQARAASP